MKAVTTIILGARDSTNQRSYLGQTSAGVTACGIASSNLNGASVVIGTDYLAYGSHSGSTRVIATNGVLLTDESGASPNNTTQGYSIGALNTAGSNGSLMNGTIQEVIVYASDQAANRTGIESNINNVYNIY